MKKFLTRSQIMQLSPTQLIKYHQELREYYSVLKEHILSFSSKYDELEKLMKHRIDKLQDQKDTLEIERMDSTEDDNHFFYIQ